MLNDDQRPKGGEEPRGDDFWDVEIEPETDSALERLGAALRQRSSSLDPELDHRVMATIRHSPRGYFRAALRWWTQPRPVRISPIGVLATVGALAILLVAVGRYFGGRGDATAVTAVASATGSASSDTRIIRFVISAPRASRVNVVGDFNGWDTQATPLTPVGEAGVWTVEVTLTPGRHEYAFLIDGREWRPDPSTPKAASDDYGSPNSVIIVGASST